MKTKKNPFPGRAAATFAALALCLGASFTACTDDSAGTSACGNPVPLRATATLPDAAAGTGTMTRAADDDPSAAVLKGDNPLTLTYAETSGGATSTYDGTLAEDGKLTFDGTSPVVVPGSKIQLSIASTDLNLSMAIAPTAGTGGTGEAPAPATVPFRTVVKYPAEVGTPTSVDTGKDAGVVTLPLAYTSCALRLRLLPEDGVTISTVSCTLNQQSTGTADGALAPVTIHTGGDEIIEQAVIFGRLAPEEKFGATALIATTTLEDGTKLDLHLPAGLDMKKTPAAGQMLTLTVRVGAILATVQGDPEITPFTDEVNGEIKTAVAEVDGRNIDRFKDFNLQASWWIITGDNDGGASATGESDNVLRNLRVQLNKRAQAGIAESAPLNLVLQDVTALPMWDDGHTYNGKGALEDESESDYKPKFNLGYVSLPAVTNIGKNAFKNCSALTTVSAPVATDISEGAFYYCSALTAVSLPAATSIGKQAFFYCTTLTDISLPAAKSIGVNTFTSCTKLTNISLPVATSIEQDAFSDCTALTHVDIPRIESIGENMFSGRIHLATVNIPAATDIKKDAFSYCRALTDISLPAATDIGESAFSACTALTTASLPEVTSIGKQTFKSCKALTNIDLPQVTKIGEEAFRGCEALTSLSLQLPTDIGDGAFQDCTGLATVSLPAATTIRQRAFQDCDELVSVSLPKATSIGSETFRGCTALISLDIRGMTGDPTDTTTDAWGFLNSVNFPDVTNCTLVLNNTTFGSGGSLNDKVTGNTFGGKTWKSITFE